MGSKTRKVDTYIHTSSVGTGKIGRYPTGTQHGTGPVPTKYLCCKVPVNYRMFELRYRTVHGIKFEMHSQGEFELLLAG